MRLWRGSLNILGLLVDPRLSSMAVGVIRLAPILYERGRFIRHGSLLSREIKGRERDIHLPWVFVVYANNISDFAMRERSPDPSNICKPLT
jgi:hypothetical protein